jgi:hypothetical protein
VLGCFIVPSSHLVANNPPDALSEAHNRWPCVAHWGRGAELIAQVSVSAGSIGLFGIVMAVQGRANWTPAIVSNRADRTEGETKVSEADGAIPGPAFSALHVTYLDSADGSSESKVLDRKIQRQVDLRFTIAVVLALALPVVIGIGCYIVTTAILRAS